MWFVVVNWTNAILLFSNDSGDQSGRVEEQVLVVIFSLIFVWNYRSRPILDTRVLLCLPLICITNETTLSSSMFCDASRDIVYNAIHYRNSLDIQRTWCVCIIEYFKCAHSLNGDVLWVFGIRWTLFNVWLHVFVFVSDIFYGTLFWSFCNCNTVLWIAYL